MKILYYFAQFDGAMYHWQDVHFINELKHHNIEIEIFNPLFLDDFYMANSKLVDKVKTSSFDLFMTCSNDKELFPETIVEIKKKMPMLLICFDNLVAPYLQKKICKYFDLVWLTSKETEKMFIGWGANLLFNPYAANPYYFKPDYKCEIDRIAFIGTPYGSRVNMINLLTKNKISVSLYANYSSINNIEKSDKAISDYITPAYNLCRFDIGRKIIAGAVKQRILGTDKLETENDCLEIKSAVGFDKLSELYSNYALSLASTAARNTGVLKKPVYIVNLRSFEIPMSGGLQICSYFKELSEYFEEDKEIIFYRSEDEFVDKAGFYLKAENESIRMQMKQAARKRAENQHTWFCRFKKVFDYFNLEYK